AAEVMAMHLRATPPPPRELWPDIPPELEDLLLAMLAKSPDQRPTMVEVVRRLEAGRGGRPRPRRPPTRRSRSAAAAAAGPGPTPAVARRPRRAVGVRADRVRLAVRDPALADRDRRARAGAGGADVLDQPGRRSRGQRGHRARGDHPRGAGRHRRAVRRAIA